SLASGTLLSGTQPRAALGGDGKVFLFNARTGERLREFEGHASDVRAIAASPDGKYLVSVSADKTVRLWPVQGGGKRLYAGIGINFDRQPGGLLVRGVDPKGAAGLDG